MSSSSSSQGSSSRLVLQDAAAIGLPVGYRFKPTDQQLVKDYLTAKAFHPTSRHVPYIPNTMDASEFFSMPPNHMVPCTMTRDHQCFIFIRQDVPQTAAPTATRHVGNRLGYWTCIKGSEEVRDSAGLLLGFKSRFNYFSTCPNGVEQTRWNLDEYRLSSPHDIRGQEWLLARLSN